MLGIGNDFVYFVTLRSWLLLYIHPSPYRMNWTAKVVDILGPEYGFTTEYRTKETTLKDLLSHRSGLARLDIGLFAGYSQNVTRTLLSKYVSIFFI